MQHNIFLYSIENMLMLSGNIKFLQSAINLHQSSLQGK